MTDSEDTAVDDEFEDEVEYEEGDVNQVASTGALDDDQDDVDDEDDDDDGYDDDDDDDAEDEADNGNRVEEATSTAVLTYVAKALSTEPEAVVVQTERQRNGVRLRLHVAQEDMGRVIGRRGRTAQAIRTLVGVAGARDGVSATVDIVDD